MADEKPKTVTVEALQVHSYNGKDYQVGDTYDIDEQFADSVQTQGKAVRVDRVAVAKKQAKDAEASVKASAKASRPVKPMTTADAPVKQRTVKRNIGKHKK